MSSAKRSQAKHAIKGDDLVSNISRTLGKKGKKGKKMNKETITSILNEFQGNLCFDNWLRKIGDFPEEQRKQLYPFSCKKIVALKDAKKWIADDELWEGVQSASNNYLFNLFQNATGKGAMVNEFGQCIAKCFHSHESLLKEKIKESKLKTDDTYIALYSIVLGAFLEYSINKMDENIKVDLNLNLLKIINDGYMPCGWSFKSEDIIEFSERPFDYSAGYLYIY